MLTPESFQSRTGDFHPITITPVPGVPNAMDARQRVFEVDDRSRRSGHRNRYALEYELKISPRFGISSLLCFILMCAASFAWVRPFEPDVRFSNIRAEQRDGTLKRNVIRVELRVSNKSGNTIWFAANEHGLIPSEVMLTHIFNHNGEMKRFYVRCDTSVYVPYDMNEQSERKRWRRVAPRQTIELHTEILELPDAEFVMEFDVHDWRGRTVNVRTPVITVAESPSGPTSDD